MSRIRVEVAPDRRQGDWQITVSSLGIARQPTQAAAIAKAVTFCNDEAARGKRLTLKIKRRDGTIRDERTYPRSSDPRRSRG